ncbi:low molecular weight protein-tyrosine-phosphatase [Thalassotalea psychrophila]|uniref:Low molecular weight protein-tyrosine-phosphatase n=1 Tax=Thalassotalea psychrophila TaxID=3065647 RepID=A0ABY9TQC7_9GAMM|nr:low molecular weight protein-tyrosine-phosphatase [Colwelliaceae bacterium SQ149]
MQNIKIESVLFVCMGNICRSPSAEAVFRHKAKEQGVDVEIDSAGTIGYHVGHKPDSRSQKTGEVRGYDFSGLFARKVVVEDFDKYSLVLAMDNENFGNLVDLAPEEHHHKIKLFLDYGEKFSETEVPDPYYGGSGGFELVLDLIEDASDGLLQCIQDERV